MEIGGHTDAQGSEEGNRTLSQTRAEAVLLALQGRQVDVSALTAVGYGESRPIADNETELGRVLTNVSGEPYQAYMRRTFLEPLGMAHTTFDAPAAASRGDYAFGYRLDGETWSRERIEPDGEVGAMGDLATTVPDYARYVSFLLDDARYHQEVRAYFEQTVSQGVA